MKQNWKLWFTVLCIVAAAYYLKPSLQFYGFVGEGAEQLRQNDPVEFFKLQQDAINLGLDLQGGIHLVMEVDTSELPPEEAIDAVDRAQEVIRNRIDQFGVAEPTIQRQGEKRIIVELPGEKDVERAKKLIGRTAQLEFQLVELSADRDRLLERISTVLGSGDPDSLAAEKTDAAADALAEDATPSLFDEATDTADQSTLASESKKLTLGAILRTYTEDVVLGSDYLDVVKSMLNDPQAQRLIPDDVEFLFGSKAEGEPGSQYYALYLVRKRPEMTGNIVGDAKVSISQGQRNFGQPIVNFITTDEGVSEFRTVTRSHIGERLAIVLDGTVYSAPTIQDVIPNGRSEISGSGTEEEAKDLAIVLRAGALPAKVEIIEDRTVGPSLGRDSIEKGRSAALFSMVAVLIFMLVYYRFTGIVANFALGINVVFVLAILSGFHATLTLPGIAGIILTIGMAVDANVLIFERIREELRNGKTVRAAIDSGYNNAFSAIIDANLTTFFVGIVLFEFGTGPIRGFALTLCVGIISSLFAAFFVTRGIFDLITLSPKVRSLSIGPVDLMANLKISFLSRYKTAFGFSGVVLAAGILSAIAINPLKGGIDFSGGTLLQMQFDPPVSVEQIRGSLRQVPIGDEILDFSSSEIKQFGSPNDILIRVSDSYSDTEVADGIKEILKSGFSANIADELEWVRRQEKVGPKIGEELTDDAVQAILTSLFIILVYIWFRFRQFLYGIAAVVALFHDVLITLGLLSVFNIEITLAVVAALLAIVGYSLNDTIVVFDRVRENLVSKRKMGFGSLLDISINDCISRTVVTSLTTLIAVLILMVWGGEVIRDFTITLFIGVIIGTYSSVFIASPVLFIGHERAAAKEKKNK
jgi:SecD/SecF fusion protein